MKILMNCLSANSGGGVSYLRNLSSPLSSRFNASQGEHELIFLAHESQRPLFGGVSGEHFHWVAGPRLTGWRRVMWERDNLIDIASNMGAEVLFSPYQIGAPVKRMKQVLMLRNMEPFLYGRYPYSLKTALRNRLLALVSSQSLRRADRIIAVSNFAYDYLTQALKISTERIQIVYHGRVESPTDVGDVERDRLSLAELGVEQRFILTCGSLLPYRRCEDVISAFDEIASSLPDGMQLVIAGAGSDQSYAARISDTISNVGTSSRILRAGHVAWDKMMALYRCCDVCVIATEIEACPNIAIEAMTAGCAIIAADRPPLPEMFEKTAYFYRARDVEKLAEGMHEVINNEHFRKTLGMRSWNRAKDFSWTKCADETYAALTEWP